MPYANKEDTALSQPAHLPSHTSTFIVCCIGSTMSAGPKSENPKLLLASVAEQVSFESYLVQQLQSRFSHHMVHM